MKGVPIWTVSRPVMTGPRIPDTVDTANAEAAALDAARDAAVVCDLEPLGVLTVTGADAEAFLQGQLSCDVSTLAQGACRYGSYNSPKGRMLANFVLWRDARANDGFAMLLSADIAEAVAKRLRMYVLRSKVAIADVSSETQRVGVGGPEGAAAIRASVRIGSGAPRSATRRRCFAPGLAGAAFRRAGARERHRSSRPLHGPRHACRLRRLALAHDPGGDAGDHRRDAGCIRRAGSEPGHSRRHRLPERLLHGSGDHRPHPIPRPPQGTDVSLPHRDARTSRPATGSTVSPSRDSPAAPSSMRHRPPAVAAIFSPCCRSPPLNGATRAFGSPDGPRLAPLPLPYAIPAPSARRGRDA